VSPVEARLRLGLAYGELREEESERLAQRTPSSDLGVVARALLSGVVAGGQSAVAADRPFIVSSQVDNVTVDEALDAILEPTEGRNRMAFFVHPHALNLARFDREFAQRLTRADLVLPDGVGIRVAARILGIGMRHNINGTDLLPLLCERARDEGVPLVLIGAAPGIAERCAERLLAAHHGLSIPVVSDGFLSEEQSGAIVDEVRKLGRCLVLVGMGSPIQERWALEHLAGLPDVTVLTVGGLFDFFSGAMPRAPLAFRELGLEWAYRLAQEPRRMARRYLLGNPLFLTLAAWQRVRGDGSDRSGGSPA